MTELREPPLLSDETLFMSFYHDGYNPEEEGADVERFMKSRDGQRAIEIAERQRFEAIKWMKEHCYIKAEERELPIRFLHPDDKPNTSYGKAQQDMLKAGFKAVRRWE